MNNLPRTIKAIEVPEGKKIHVIELIRISFFEAAGKNTRVHFVDKSIIVSTKMLKHYHDILHEKQGFYRVHRKYLVNVEHIVSIEDEKGTVHLRRQSIPLIHYGPVSDSVN